MSAYIVIAETVENPITAMQYITGSIIVGGLFEMLLGFGRLIGMLRKAITSVVIGPILSDSGANWLNGY